MLLHTTGSTTPCPKTTGYEPGHTTSLRHSTTLPLLAKHVVFRKISRLPSQSKPSRNVVGLNNHAPSYKLDSVPELRNKNDYPAWRDSAVFILETFGCWKIVEGIESEPTKDGIKMMVHF